MTEPTHNPPYSEVRRDLLTLLSAASNFFIAKKHLTLPEGYEHEQKLLQTTNDLLSKYHTP